MTLDGNSWMLPSFPSLSESSWNSLLKVKEQTVLQCRYTAMLLSSCLGVKVMQGWQRKDCGFLNPWFILTENWWLWYSWFRPCWYPCLDKSGDGEGGGVLWPSTDKLRNDQLMGRLAWRYFDGGTAFKRSTPNPKAHFSVCWLYDNSHKSYQRAMLLVVRSRGLGPLELWNAK